MSDKRVESFLLSIRFRNFKKLTNNIYKVEGHDLQCGICCIKDGIEMILSAKYDDIYHLHGSLCVVQSDGSDGSERKVGIFCTEKRKFILPISHKNVNRLSMTTFIEVNSGNKVGIFSPESGNMYWKE